MEPAPAEPENTSAFSTIALLALGPMLHSYAQRRRRSTVNADDAVQDTLERAWGARHTFRPGADIKPWIFQIMRNVIVDHFRQGKRTTQDSDGKHARRLASHPSQMWKLYYSETIAALGILTADQKRAILLIAFGATTVEAATVMGCPLGTLKSHLRLARGKLNRR